MKKPDAILSKHSNLVVVSAALIVLAAAITRNIADPDLFGYLAFGRLFFENHSFPYHDVFSYYPTNPEWVYHEWLSGIFFYALYAKIGPAVLQVLKYALAGGAIWLTWSAARRAGASAGSFAICLLVGANVFGLGYNPVRAQVFTYFFFALTLYLLERARQDHDFKGLWLLAPMFGIWGALHGGFPAGLGLILLYSVGHLISGARGAALRHALFLLACAFITILNPYGIAYWKFLISSIAMHRPYIIEWWPLLKTMIHGFYLPASVIFILMASSVVGAGRNIINSGPWAALVLSATAAMGFFHHRHVVFFAIAFFAMMPPVLQSMVDNNTKNSAEIGNLRKLILVSILTLGIGTNIYIFYIQTNYLISGDPFSLRTPSKPPEQPHYPVGAVKYIKDNSLSGNVLTDFHWGEYMLWSLYPECRTAVDGRYETVFPPEVVEEHFLAFENSNVNRTDFQNYMKKHPHQMAVTWTGSRAHELLEELPGWTSAYEDEGCVLYLRLNL